MKLISPCYKCFFRFDTKDQDMCWACPDRVDHDNKVRKQVGDMIYVGPLWDGRRQGCPASP